jgi:hypothetical protein
MDKNNTKYRKKSKSETDKSGNRQPKLKQVLCRKASVTRIPGKDHWHQTAVTTYTENSPFQGYTNISKSNKSCCQFSN